MKELIISALLGIVSVSAMGQSFEIDTAKYYWKLDPTDRYGDTYIKTPKHDTLACYMQIISENQIGDGDGIIVEWKRGYVIKHWNSIHCDYLYINRKTKVRGKVVLSVPL